MSRPLHIDEYRMIVARLFGTDRRTARALVDSAKAESALNAAFAEFGGQQLFPDPVRRAAVTCSRLNRNHAIPDFNKRASVVVLGIMLDELGLEIGSTPEEFAARIEGLADHTLSEDDFIGWVEHNVRPMAPPEAQNPTAQ